MTDITPMYPLKAMNQAPKIGIGITTYKRPDVLTQCLAGFKAFMPPNAVIHVNDDSEREEGVAAAKNRCISALEDCDYIFLFDDDVWPQKKFWWIPFIRGAIDHNCHVFASTWDSPNSVASIINKNGTLCSLSRACGGCVFLTSHVIKHIGGYDIAFGRRGGEHEEFLQRAWLNGLSPHRLCDIEDSSSYFHSLEKLNVVNTSINFLEVTPAYITNFYISHKSSAYRLYKPSDVVFIQYNTSTNRHILENWIKTVPDSYTVYMFVDKQHPYKIDRINHIDVTAEQIGVFSYVYRQYINSITLTNPSCLSAFAEVKQCATAVLGLDDNPQPWLRRFPNLSIAKKVHSPAYTYIPKDNVLKYMGEYNMMMRHPMYCDSPSYIAANIVPLPSKKPVYIDMRPVLMILGCKRYRKSMEAAISRFSSTMWNIVAVEGGGDSTSYDEATRILTLDVEDTYDRLPLKVYKAFMWILAKWPNAAGVFKTDEDIWFKDLKELEMHIAMRHTQLFWGMRVDKVDGGPVSDLSMMKMVDKTPGKTYPASHYCWGHGYYIARGALELLKACNGDYEAQYLEDVCTGACLNRFGITPVPIKMKYIEVDRDAILRGEVKIQDGHKFDTVAWQQ